MSKFGLENLEPLFEDHQFKGIKGIIGSNCRVCGGPITEPWHHPKRDLKSALEKAEEQHEGAIFTPQK